MWSKNNTKHSGWWKTGLSVVHVSIHTVPFSNQELTFILAFDRLVNIPISDSSAPPLPRTHAHTHTHTHPRSEPNKTKKKLLSYVSHVRMVPDTLIG